MIRRIQLGGWPWIVLLLAGGLVSGCGGKQSPTTVDPIPPDGVILAYTAGINPMRELYQNEGLGPMLTEVLGRTVVPGGVQKELSLDALKRLPEVLRDVRPSLMILGYGVTDLHRRQDREALKSNLRSMVELARAADVDVVMVAMPKPGFSMKPDPLYEELAQALHVPTEMHIAHELLRTNSMKGERLTLNDAGLRRFAEALRDLLIAAGALEQESTLTLKP